MDRRVGAGTAGAVLAAGLLAVAAVISPWRPSGLAAGLVLLGVAAPAAAYAGTRFGLRVAGEADLGAGRVAALGTPPSALLVLFVLNALVGTGGRLQVVALLAGTALASSLAVRFTDPVLAED